MISNLQILITGPSLLHDQNAVVPGSREFVFVKLPVVFDLLCYSTVVLVYSTIPDYSTCPFLLSEFRLENGKPE
jgi:hypothetical protein